MRTSFLPEADPHSQGRDRLSVILFGVERRKNGLILPEVKPHTTAIDVIVFAGGMLAGAAVVFMMLWATTGGTY